MLVLGLLLIRYRFDLAVPDGWSLAPDPTVHPYPAWRLLPAVLLLGLVAGGVTWLYRSPGPLRRGAIPLALSGLMVAQIGLQVTADWGRGPAGWADNAVASTWSTISNGYLFEATKVDSSLDLLRQYHTIQAKDDKKLGTHPPGAVLLYRVALDLWRICPPAQILMLDLVEWLPQRSRGIWTAAMQVPNVPREFDPSDVPETLWCLLFVALLGATAVLPCYWLGAAGGNPRTGLLAAALLTMTPNTIFYYLSLDVVLMALAAWGLAGVVYAVRGDRLAPWPALGAGLAFGISGLISLSTAAPILLAIAYLALGAATRRVTPRAAGQAAALVLAGVLTVLLTVTLLGLQTALVYRTALHLHRAGGGGIGHRQYLPWLVFNVVDYGVFLGLPLLVVLAEAVVKWDLPGGVAPTLLAATLGTLCLLDLSGTVKAETERLWLFFNPPLVAAVAAAVESRADRGWPIASQPLQLVLMALALPPLVRPY